MGKHLLSSKESTVQFQDNKPGCMWGLLHMLDTHHWHNVKKVFPHKKHHWGRHPRHQRKPTIYNHSISEDQEVGDAEVKPLLVRQHSKKVSATGKRTTRSRKKGLHTESRSKEESSKGWILSFHAEPQHLGSSDKSSMDYSSQNHAAREYELPLEKDVKTREFVLSQKLKEANKLNRDVSDKFKEHIDVFEVFKAEKDLLLQFLRDLNANGKSFRKATNNKARLTKSGSFPLATSSHMRNINPSTLNHKQTEIWAFPKGEKLLAGTQANKMFASSFAKDISYMKAVPLASDHGVDSAMKQNPGFSFSRSSQGLNHKGWNQLVLHRFKVIKQKIKYALMELTKNGSSEYRLHNNGKEVSQSLEDGMIENRGSKEIKASDYDSNKHEIRLIRRTSSLNESLDRYTQLFERSFGKDIIKWRSSMSNSLKVTNEDKNHMSGYAPKLSKRNLSLPNIESISFILHEAICDTDNTGIPSRTSLDYNTNAETDILVQRKSVSVPVNKDKPFGPTSETEIQKMVENSGKDVTPNPLSEKNDEGQREDIHEPEVENGSFTQENEEIETTINLGKDAMAVTETSYEDNAANVAKGTERNTRGSSMEEMDIDLLNTGNRYTLPAEDTNKSRERYVLLFESDVENDSDFKYVKHIIEFSGFMEDEHTQMQHSVNQPLKPSLFKDLEASLPEEIECSGEEIGKPSDHQLLFNIVNEVLLEICEGSSTYFPRPFSFNHRLHPMPKGSHLLKEVWNRVNSYLSLRPELDQTLDDVVGRDLARSGWMNFQWEEENVALELEDMIVDDLLDEIIFS